LQTEYLTIFYHFPCYQVTVCSYNSQSWVVNSVNSAPRSRLLLRNLSLVRKARYVHLQLQLYILYFQPAYQTPQVFIVTGASSGVGKELAQILFSRDAKVYVATRSEERASEAIDSIKAAVPDSQGSLVFLKLDLDDLTTIKSSAEEFLAKEQRLDVLWNNAGVMFPPGGHFSPIYTSYIRVFCIY